MNQLEMPRGEASVSDRSPYCYERTPDERPSEAVVTAVADASGKPAVPGRSPDGTAAALQPLYDVIDPDALDSFVSAANSRGSDCSVQFTYGGCFVTVTPRTVRVTTTD